MGKKRTMQLTVVIIVALMICMLAAVLLTGLLDAYRGTSIQLPVPGQTYYSGGGQDPTRPLPGDRYVRVDIAPDNVVEVVRTLARPPAYSITARVETYYAAARHSAQVTHHVSGDSSATLQSDDSRTSHTLRGGGWVYFWEEGGEVLRLPEGGFGPDAAAAFPTYEALLDIRPADILSASYEEYEGFSCVFFSTWDEELSLHCDYYVDIASGLLVLAESSQNGSLIYRMQATDIVVDDPPESAFALPSGAAFPEG